jgi:hypothetical protein
MADLLRNAIDFWEKLAEDKEASVKFVKKDGTIRIMKCTLDFTKIPKKDQPKTFNMPKILRLMKNSGIIHVYDLEKKGWRSVPFKEVDWMETPKQRYKIAPYR